VIGLFALLWFTLWCVVAVWIYRRDARHPNELTDVRALVIVATFFMAVLAIAFINWTGE